MNNKPTLSQLFSDVANTSRKTVLYFNYAEPVPHQLKSEDYYIYDYLYYLAEAIAMLVKEKSFTYKQYKIMKKHRASLETVMTKHKKYIVFSGYDATKI